MEIEYTPYGSDVFIPTLRAVPSWYKRMPKEFENEPTVKQCMPFLDSITLGYCITAPMDIIVKRKNGIASVLGHPIVGIRKTNQIGEMSIPAGCDNTHFVWDTPVSLQVPEDYSIIFTHPLNRFDLPFVTVSAVVDGGFVLDGGSVPFFLKSDFVGTILKGTPIIQVIPFKRDNWVSKEVPENNFGLRGELPNGWYKHNRWHKKSYK